MQTFTYYDVLPTSHGGVAGRILQRSQTSILADLRRQAEEHHRDRKPVPFSKKGRLPRTLCDVQAVVNSRTRSHRTRNLRHPVAWQETTLGPLVSSPSARVQQDC